MFTFAIANQKGGVGKTTTAYNLAAGLGKEYSVLLIDLDGQGNLTRMAGFIPGRQPSSYSLLSKENTIENTIKSCEYFDFIPASSSLTTADQSIEKGIGRNMRLKEALASYARNPDNIPYDFCIIDTPPALGVVTNNALIAADFVIIPAEANELSTEGIISVVDSVEDIKKYVNPQLEVFCILLTRYRGNTTLGKEYYQIFEKLAFKMHTILYPTAIRESIIFSELPSVHQSVFEYKPRSNAAKDYQELVNGCAMIATEKQKTLKMIARHDEEVKAEMKAAEERIRQRNIREREQKQGE